MNGQSEISLAYALYYVKFRVNWFVFLERFRRSNDDVLGRAKRRTLKMTITIVIVFIVCWTPFYVMSIWYWLDHETALKVDQRIQKGLFLFACTNSCMNPIVYGAYNIRRKGDKLNTVMSIFASIFHHDFQYLSETIMHRNNIFPNIPICRL